MHILASDEEISPAPVHWHEMHDELFRVVQGRTQVRIGNETRIFVPEDGEVRIPKRTLHGLKLRNACGEIVESQSVDPFHCKSLSVCVADK